MPSQRHGAVLLAFSLAVLSGGSGNAQDLTAEEARDNLRRQVQAQDARTRADGQATRSIVIHDGAGTEVGSLYPADGTPAAPAAGQAAPAVPMPVVPAPPLQFRVEFELNSYRLTPETRRTLAVVANALRDPQVAGRTWEVIGHTDALGSARYNQALSENRAASVADGLELLGAQARLVPTGRGESELLAGRAPNDPANRRVEIRIAAP